MSTVEIPLLRESRAFAARLVEKLYVEGDSPLRYRINRLGGRSQRDKCVDHRRQFSTEMRIGNMQHDTHAGNSEPVAVAA